MAKAADAQHTWDITIVWRLVERTLLERPEISVVINDWQQGVLQQLQRNKKAITDCLHFADEISLALSESGKRIYDGWGVPPTQLLPRRSTTRGGHSLKACYQKWSSLPIL